MKILWITNKITHAVADYIGYGSETPGGGWIDGLFESLLRVENLNLSVAFPHPEKLDGEAPGFSFHSFNYCPFHSVPANVVARIEGIIEQEKPDVIHIFGSEFTHAYAAAEAAQNTGLLEKTVVNIQGIISACAEHYTDGLPHNVINRYTFKDIISGNTIKNQQKDFWDRAKWEEKLFQKVKHVVGRTDFDKSCVLKMNPEINYYFCNETLRKEFYSGEWNCNDCEKHTVFISQAAYPIKGLHCFLPAAAILKNKYPDLKVYIAGQNMQIRNLADYLRAGSYKLYLNHLVAKHGLKKNIVFLGPLRSLEMKKQYLRANAFVSPSVMENSSNSIGEAMILGVPVVSSKVGGVESILSHLKEGLLYDYCDAEALAECVDKIFADNQFATKISQNAKTRARKTHCIENNNNSIIEIYKKIK